MVGDEGPSARSWISDDNSLFPTSPDIGDKIYKSASINGVLDNAGVLVVLVAVCVFLSSSPSPSSSFDSWKVVSSLVSSIIEPSDAFWRIISGLELGLSSFCSDVWSYPRRFVASGWLWSRISNLHTGQPTLDSNHTAISQGLKICPQWMICRTSSFARNTSKEMGHLSLIGFSTCWNGSVRVDWRICSLVGTTGILSKKEEKMPFAKGVNAGVLRALLCEPTVLRGCWRRMLLAEFVNKEST